jgi:hypothetical protein
MQPRQVRRMRHYGEKPRDLFRPTLHLFTVLAWACLSPGPVRAAETEEGLALAIVYDTSGSMRDSVATADGKRAAKYVIGNRALELIIHRIERFATNSPARTVHAGLFVFSGTGAREAVKLGPFHAGRLLDWVKSYRGPDSGTPLGTTLETASQAVLNSKLSQKHVLVVTDGMNTSGPDPVAVLPRIQKTAEGRKTTVFVHFVAFDIDAKVFAPLKKMGVDVSGAVDETQLNQQLEFILEEKILLEKPEKK